MPNERLSNRIGRLPWREMSDIIQRQQLKTIGEVMVYFFKRRRWITRIGPAVDDQGGGLQLGDAAQLLVQFIVSTIHWLWKKPATIAIQGNGRPIGIIKTNSCRQKLLFFVPTFWAPRIPLDL